MASYPDSGVHMAHYINLLAKWLLSVLLALFLFVVIALAVTLLCVH